MGKIISTVEVHAWLIENGWKDHWFEKYRKSGISKRQAMEQCRLREGGNRRALRLSPSREYLKESGRTDHYDPIVLFAGRDVNKAYDGSSTWGFTLDKERNVEDFKDKGGAPDLVALYAISDSWLYLIPIEDLLEHFTPHPNNKGRRRWCIRLIPDGCEQSKQELGHEPVLCELHDTTKWMCVQKYEFASPGVSFQEWYNKDFLAQ